jgi:hypothetical protein
MHSVQIVCQKSASVQNSHCVLNGTWRLRASVMMPTCSDINHVFWVAPIRSNDVESSRGTTVLFKRAGKWLSTQAIYSLGS